MKKDYTDARVLHRAFEKHVLAFLSEVDWEQFGEGFYGGAFAPRGLDEETQLKSCVIGVDCRSELEFHLNGNRIRFSFSQAGWAEAQGYLKDKGVKDEKETD